MATKEEILAKANEVLDPELGLSVVDLGLIYDIAVLENGIVRISMTLTTPACPYGPDLIAEVEGAVKEIKGVEAVDINIVWDPPWNPAEMASEYAKDVLGLW